MSLPDPAGADHPPTTAPEKVVSPRGLRIAAVAVATIAAAIVVVSVTSRKMADARLNDWAERQAVPVVAVAKPDTRGKRATLDIPGRLEAYSQAQIYARVSGYLKEWKADIGAPVKAGQLLAEIDAPDLDQQFMQAEADLASAQANATLAKANLERGQSLITSGAVTRRDLDQRDADFSSRQSAVRGAQANVDRLRVMEKYKLIVAPFDGVVSARATDVGALINAGGGGGPALFVVSDTSKLRVYINVPQSFAPSVKIGTKAQISVPEYENRTFPATVEATSQAVDVVSGTTRMLLVVDNKDGELMTGAFANVRLELPNPETAISVPASALIFGQDGLSVAILDDDDRIVLRKVTVSRDLGKDVEIGSGLSAQDRVVTSPPDGIVSGDRVRLSAENGVTVRN